jgi:3-deoxy-D-manno-octulosonic-acid transferase
MHILVDLLNLLLGIALVPVWLVKLPRGQRYRSGVLERLGFAPELQDAPRLWVHCASVGEAAVPQPLVERIRRRYPDWDVVFSTNTDTGAERLRSLYPDATVFYYPLDFSPCVAAAMRRVKPSAVLLVELEVWPNFMRLCHVRGVPVGIISGRIGSSSRRWLPRMERFMPWLWKPVAACCARSEDDARGFVAAGLPEEVVHTTGSLKYDSLAVEPDMARVDALRDVFCIDQQQRVIVGGSTWPGEEAALAASFDALREHHPDLRLVVAPRHVERADEAAADLAGRGLNVVRKTALDAGDAEAGPDDTILVDTVGDLAACYGMAYAAFIGRSLEAPGGGQNMMEPAGLGVPVLVGPHTKNFRPEMKLLQAADAVVVVEGPEELTRALRELLDDPAAAALKGQAAREVILRCRGSAERTLDCLDPLLAQSQPGRAAASPDRQNT